MLAQKWRAAHLDAAARGPGRGRHHRHGVGGLGGELKGTHVEAGVPLIVEIAFPAFSGVWKLGAPILVVSISFVRLHGMSHLASRRPGRSAAGRPAPDGRACPCGTNPTCSVLIAPNRSQSLRFHARRALDKGLRPRELSEIVTQLAVYRGWPMASAAVSEPRAPEGEAGADLRAGGSGRPVVPPPRRPSAAPWYT